MITTTTIDETPSAADLSRLARAAGAIESAKAQVDVARRAVAATGQDTSGLERIDRELDRELRWLRG